MFNTVYECALKKTKSQLTEVGGKHCSQLQPLFELLLGQTNASNIAQYSHTTNTSSAIINHEKGC